MAKMVDLETPYEPVAALAPSGKSRVIRVRYLRRRDRRGHWYIDGWPWPVPAWTRRLDGRTWRGVAAMAGLALAAFVAGAWWLARLVGRTHGN